MTPSNPTPYAPPDGVTLTTMREARRIGHGQVATVLYDDWSDLLRWGGLDPTWRSDRLVWWRPTPERLVAIELPESAARETASPEWLSATGDDVVHNAARAAVARLDGDA